VVASHLQLGMEWDVVRAVVDWVLRLGLLGAVSAWARGAWTAWRQRKAERRGLLRLTDIEIERNERVMEEWGTSITEPQRHLTDPLDTDTWEQSRVALTQVLDEEEFSMLVTYYEDARRLNNLWSPESSPAVRIKTGPDVQYRLEKCGEQIREWIRSELDDREAADREKERQG
jgi:hypothetical protein